MPDPVVPIVAAVLATLSFLLAAKNSLSAIASDVEHLKSYSADFQSLAVRFLQMRSKLEAWQKLWKIHEDLGLGYYQRLWGDRYIEVEIALDAISARIEHLRQYFGPLLEHPTGDGSDDKHLFFRKIRRDGLRKRLWKSFIRHPIIANHLTTLEVDIDNLQRISLNRLQIHHGHSRSSYEGTNLADIINSKFYEEILDLVSRNSQMYSQDLFNELLGNARCCSAFLAIERLLELPREADAFEGDYGAQSVIYDIIYNIRDVDHEESYRCQVSKTIRPLPQDAETNDDGVRPHLEALHHVAVNDGTIDTIPSSSLRQLLCGERNNFKDQLHGPTTVMMRIRLAYQLVKFTRVLMDTGWTTNLCSCTVNFTTAPTGKQYYVSVGREIQHFQPGTGMSFQDMQQWCQQLEPLPVRRLGLLLTEIAIGTALHNAILNQDVIEVEFASAEIAGGQRTPSFIDDIKRKVESAAGPTYAEVVSWCLATPEPGCTPDEALENFYHDIFRPVHKLYVAICERDRVRRRRNHFPDIYT